MPPLVGTVGEVRWRRPVVGNCPVCGERLEVERLRCPRCHTALEGRLALCPFCAMTEEQREFARVFIAARGNLREMERMLGLSYPTVRARLESVIEALGYRVERGEVVGEIEPPGPVRPAQSARAAEPAGPATARHAPAQAAWSAPVRRAILQALERGEITPDEAIARLRGEPAAGRQGSEAIGQAARQAGGRQTVQAAGQEGADHDG